MAAPTVGAVLGDILPYLEVEQVYDVTDPASKQVRLPDLTGLTAAQATTALKETTLEAVFIGSGEAVTDQLPFPDETVSGGSQVLVYLGEDAPDQVRVPDFVGMSVAQANTAAANAGLCVQATGNPDLDTALTAAAQNIAPGTQVAAGTTVKLQFTDPQARD